jgi:hypothetical protein
VTVDPTTFHPREVIDHWRLIRPLGHGAWLAEDVLVEGSNVRVEPSVYSDPNQHERAWRLLAKVRRHPGFVNAVALVTKDGPTPHMLVLDAPEGQTLEERVASAPLSTDEAVAILQDVARAVAEMHDAGFVHSRLEPAVIHLGTETGTRLWSLGRCLTVGLSADPVQDVPGLARCLYAALTGRPSAEAWLEGAVVLDPGPRAPDHLRRLIVACTTERAYDCPGSAKEFLNRLTPPEPVKPSPYAVILPPTSTQRVVRRPDPAGAVERPAHDAAPPVRAGSALREPPVRGEPTARPGIPPVRNTDPRKDPPVRADRGAEPPVKVRPTLPVVEPTGFATPATNPGVEGPAVRMVRLREGGSSAEKVPSATKDWEGKGSEPDVPRDTWVVPAPAAPPSTPWTAPPAIPEVPRFVAPPSPPPPPRSEGYFTAAGVVVLLGLAVIVAALLVFAFTGAQALQLELPAVVAQPAQTSAPAEKGAELCVTNRERLGAARILVDGVADATGERCVHKASEDSVRFQVFCAVEPASRKNSPATAAAQPWVIVVEQGASTSVICDPGTRPCHCHLPSKPEDL